MGARRLAPRGSESPDRQRTSAPKSITEHRHGIGPMARVSSGIVGRPIAIPEPRASQKFPDTRLAETRSVWRLIEEARVDREPGNRTRQLPERDRESRCTSDRRR